MWHTKQRSWPSFMVLVCLIVSGAGRAEGGEQRPDAAIRPGADGVVSAKVLPNGQVQLENDLLKCVFDPEDRAAARSIVHKPSGKEMAVVGWYSETHYKAFREDICGAYRKTSAQGVTSGYGPRYQLIGLEARDGRAVAVFSGYPYTTVGPPRFRLEPPVDAEKDYAKVRVVKTYALRQGVGRLDVNMEAINESGQMLPLALLTTSGLRIEGEDTDVFLPTPQGTRTMLDTWVKTYSDDLTASRAAAPWTGLIARDERRLGLYLAGRRDQIETISDYLAKFTGTLFVVGGVMYDVDPGKSMQMPLSLVSIQGISRLDGATPDLACGIVFEPDKVKKGVPFTVTIEAAAPAPVEGVIALRLRRVTQREGGLLGEQPLRTDAPGGSGSARFTAQVDEDGVYVLEAKVSTKDGKTVSAERDLDIGLTTESYEAAEPQLAGKRHFSILYGDQPLPDYLTKLDRTVEYPMVPWNVPAARKAKVLFACETDWTPGSLRELGRRAGCEWDLAYLYGKEAGGSGPYRDMEQKSLEEKLAAFQPECLFTAGVRFDAMRRDVQGRILARVQKGMGLVMVGCTIRGYADWPPKLVATEGMRKSEADFTGPLAGVLSSAVCGKQAGGVECYDYGKGRIVVLTKMVQVTRDCLFPVLGEATLMPDEEYHFAQYVQAVRYAIHEPAPVRIQKLDLRADRFLLGCTSDREREATLVYTIVSPDLVEVEHGARPVKLSQGQSEVTVETTSRPGGAYVLHAWLLDGTKAEGTAPTAKHPLYRKAFSQPVLDFSASYATVASPVRIKQIIVQSPGPTPQSVEVRLEADPGQKADGLTVEAQIMNGGRDRMVWRSAAPVPAGMKVVFNGLQYEPVDRANLIVARVLQNDAAVARGFQRFQSGPFAKLDPQDAHYGTATGIHEYLFPFRVMREWADEAGIDFDYGAGFVEAFPWKRKSDKTTDPPMVNLDVCRDVLTRGLSKYTHGGLVAMFDEFKIGDEYDRSPETLKAFAASLAKSYGTVEALNASWGTGCKTFDEAVPVLLKDVDKEGRLAPWIDFRLFMDDLINARFRIAAEEAAKVSPDLRTGDSGTYEPGYLIGVHYLKMCQPSRHMIAYPGLRADWIRAFCPPDAVINIWRGYGHQNATLPWSELFDGYTGIGWWGYMPSGGVKFKSTYVKMGVVGADHTPARNYRQIGRVQSEIRRGIGKLFLTAEPSAPRAYIPYSQVSAYVANIFERNYANASNCATTLLKQAGIRYSFVGDEQAAEGRLSAMRDVFFLLPGIDALPSKAAEGYAEAVGRGCSLLAGAEAGLRDGHGNRTAKDAPFDRFLGLDRSQAAAVKPGEEPEKVAWTAGAPAELRKRQAALHRGLKGVKSAGGTVWAAFADGTPAVVASPDAKGGGGLAVWINTRFEWLDPRAKDDAANETVKAVMSHVLARAKITAPVRLVTPDGEQPVFAGIFENGRARYYGILVGTEAREVGVVLPQTAHTYDVRDGAYLGVTDRFKARIGENTVAKVYAQLPYRVTGVEVNLAKNTLSGGDRATVAGRVVADAPVTELHIVHCRMISPAGDCPRYDQANLAAPGGAFETSFPLPLNAKPGTCAIEATDVASGLSKKVTFEVK